MRSNKDSLSSETFWVSELGFLLHQGTQKLIAASTVL